jgi:hypothetical protein
MSIVSAKEIAKAIKIRALRICWDVLWLDIDESSQNIDHQ